MHRSTTSPFDPFIPERATLDLLVDDYGVCLNCLQLDLAAIFSPKPYEYVINAITVHNAQLTESICRFCALLLQVGRQLNGRGYLEAQSAGSNVAFYFRQVLSGHERTNSVSLRVEVYPAPIALPDGATPVFFLCPVFLSGTDNSLLSARLISQDQIDIGLCRSWLKDCEQAHPKQCHDLDRRKHTVPNEFRVIDVVDQCVVRASDTPRYVALTYVWGLVETMSLRLENVDQLEQRGSLADLEGAQTTKDAMEVVKRMGERYLWVDRLCIVQDAPSKQHQIENMDKIYGAAVLTIVAADGTNANHGITGIGLGSRHLDQLVQTFSEDLALAVSVLPPPEITGTAWAWRGWTCQEQLLSRRLLIFTHGQALWQCTSCFLCEDTDASHKARQLTRVPQMSLSSESPTNATLSSSAAIPGHLIRPPVFSRYASIINDYSKRHLTFAEDVWRAFQGFGSIFETQFRCKLLAALPEAYLDQALLWLPQAPQRRRPSQMHCPSWSWTGWIGQARYDDVEPSGRERIVPIAKWYAIEENSNPRPINETGIGISEHCLSTPRSLNTYVWVPLYEMLSGQRGSSTSLEQTALSGSIGPYLQAWTSCTFLRISPKPIPEDFRDRSMDLPLQMRIEAKDGKGFAGHLVLNGTEQPRIEERRHEFIVLSEAQVSSFNLIGSTCTYGDRCMMYNVMLVEWDDERRVAYRLGVGRVYKNMWHASKPMIKLVTLC